MAREFFGFTDEHINQQNWEALYDRAAAEMSADNWSEEVLRKSKLEAVFLTNDFDDPLEGFDTSVYIPCLRTDDLVFHLARPEVQDRLDNATNSSFNDPQSLKEALGQLFQHFTDHQARACAISLPPDFAPAPVSDNRVRTAIEAIRLMGNETDPSHCRVISNYVFWTLTELCADYQLPFDLMIGVNRGVYASGVYQGQDLYDSRV